jgi:hypothetical protein
VDLQLAEHDADTVLDENLEGATDLIVVAAALREGRILLTLVRERPAARWYWISSDPVWPNFSAWSSRIA